MRVAGADLARPLFRNHPRSRPRGRCVSFDFEHEDEDDWSTSDVAT